MLAEILDLLIFKLIVSRMLVDVQTVKHDSFEDFHEDTNLSEKKVSTASKESAGSVNHIDSENSWCFLEPRVRKKGHVH